MPVPWPTDGLGARKNRRISCPSEHGGCPIQLQGISLRQLRDLQNLLERVCKASLLVCEHWEGHRGVHGFLSWPLVDQRDMRYKIIRKIIPKGNSCSWVELVAERPQKPKYFVSHNWSEPFRDFMVSLEHHVVEAGVRQRDVYWICVFALNQWAVDVGTDLESSPFVTALRVADSAVLMLDKTASSLSRLWCLLEVYVILQKHETLLQWTSPRLRVLTPMGVLGSPCVSRGPVVEALMNTDCTLATASDPTDHRQILNYLAGVPETTGLVVEDGQFVQPKQLDPSMPKGKYEAHLLETQNRHFKHFDDTLHTWAEEQEQRTRADRVMDGSPSPGPPTLIKLPSAEMSPRSLRTVSMRRIPPADRGLTLAQIRTMWRRLKRRCREWQRIGRKADKRDAGIDATSNLLPQDNVTLFDYVWEYLRKDSEEECVRSYMETLNTDPQDPEYFVTVPYSMLFKDVMASIEWHAEARELPDNTVYWAWFFSLSLQDLRDWFKKKDGTTPTEIVMEKQPTLDGIVVIVDEDLGSFKRLNPVYELHRFLFDYQTNNGYVDICCKNGVLSSSKPFRGQAYQFGTFDLSVAEAMLEFDVTKLEAKTDAEKSTREQILALIAGRSSANRSAALLAFNWRVRRLGCGPVLRASAINNDARKIEHVLEKTKILLVSSEVRGVHGEGPLMVAAARGSLRAMETLLRLKADPNERDASGETPLHYAALGGQLEAAELLLRVGARTDLLSVFEEKPSQVAAQNPAFFLGVDTTAVGRLLAKVERISLRLNLSCDDLDMEECLENGVVKPAETAASLGITTEREPSAKSILTEICQRLDVEGRGRLTVETLINTLTPVLSAGGDSIDDILKLLRVQNGEVDYDGYVDYVHFINWVFDERDGLSSS